MLDIHWNSALISRYGAATQPTATCLIPANLQPLIGSPQLLQALHDCPEPRSPLSLQVQLPLCPQACRHCERVQLQGCDPELIEAYGMLLEREIKQLGTHVDRRHCVERLHFRGASAMIFGSRGLRLLMTRLDKYFNLSARITRDFQVDLDPRMADWSSMGLLRELGFNRLNLRVEELAPQVQATINYWPNVANIRTLIDAAHTLQFRSVSIELVRGLPGQNAEYFADTIGQIIALQPDRVVLRQYHHQPEHFKAQRQLANLQLPSPDECLAILQCAVERLQIAGYRYIGADLFALPDDDLAAAQEDGQLHMGVQGLALLDCEELGIGVAALSRIGSLYCQNHSNFSDYRRCLENDQLATQQGLLHDPEQTLQHAIYTQLICQQKLSFERLEQLSTMSFRQRFSSIWPALKQMEQDGAITLDENSLHLTAGGLLLTESLYTMLRNSPPTYLAPP